MIILAKNFRLRHLCFPAILNWKGCTQNRRIQKSMIETAENNYAEGLLIKCFLSLKRNKIESKIKRESNQRAKVFCDAIRGKKNNEGI